jgi:single-strand DNA-binding protein
LPFPEPPAPPWLALSLRSQTRPSANAGLSRAPCPPWGVVAWRYTAPASFCTSAVYEERLRGRSSSFGEKVGRAVHAGSARSKQNSATSFDVSVYGAPGESVCNYMRKGSRVGIDGRLEWREWETADQQKRQAVSVVADTVQFLDGPGDRPGAGGGEDHAHELVGVGAGDAEESVF